MARVSVIVAMSRNRVIGRDNALPWRLPAELERFKALTWGHHIVMGRKTWESIKRLLPGRTSVVITRDRAFKLPGAKVASSLDDALRQCGADPEVFVIGGAQIFRAALPLADRVYLTTIDATIEGDTFMPAMDLSGWHRIAAETHLASESNPLPWTFEIYERPPRRGTTA